MRRLARRLVRRGLVAVAVRRVQQEALAGLVAPLALRWRSHGLRAQVPVQARAPGAATRCHCAQACSRG